MPTIAAILLLIPKIHYNELKGNYVSKIKKKNNYYPENPLKGHT